MRRILKRVIALAAFIAVAMAATTLASCNKDDAPETLYTYQFSITEYDMATEDEVAEFKEIYDAYTKQFGGSEFTLRGEETACNDYVLQRCNTAYVQLVNKTFKHHFTVTVTNATTSQTIYTRDY